MTNLNDIHYNLLIVVDIIYMTMCLHLIEISVLFINDLIYARYDSVEKNLLSKTHQNTLILCTSIYTYPPPRYIYVIISNIWMNNLDMKTVEPLKQYKTNMAEIVILRASTKILLFVLIWFFAWQ